MSINVRYPLIPFVFPFVDRGTAAVAVPPPSGVYDVTNTRYYTPAEHRIIIIIITSLRRL